MEKKEKKRFDRSDPQRRYLCKIKLGEENFQFNLFKIIIEFLYLKTMIRKSISEIFYLVIFFSGKMYSYTLSFAYMTSILKSW